MRHIRLAAVLLACAALTTGCGTRPTGSGGGSGGASGGGSGSGGAGEELRGRAFLSTSITENGAPRPLAPGTRVSLRFTDDGRLLADAGCNTMAGPVQTRGGRLAVTDLSTTEMGCDPPRHEQDRWLAGVLAAGPSWRLDGSTLVLTSAATELALTDRTVAEPDLPLEGTTWVVDTIVDGQAASSTPAGGTASVIFDAGEATVSTGCNSGSAPYQVSGTALVLGDLVITKQACRPDLAPLEQAVLAVLQGQVAFAIDADRLRLDHPSGKGGLQLRGGR